MWLGYSEGSVELICRVCCSRRSEDLREAHKEFWCYHGQTLHEWKRGPSLMVSLGFTLATGADLEEYQGLRPNHFVGLDLSD